MGRQRCGGGRVLACRDCRTIGCDSALRMPAVGAGTLKGCCLALRLGRHRRPTLGRGCRADPLASSIGTRRSMRSLPGRRKPLSESDVLTPLTCRPPAGPGSISSQSCPFSFAARPKLASGHDSLPAAASTAASTPRRFCQGCQVPAQGARRGAPFKRRGLGLLRKPVPAIPACRVTAPTCPLTFYSGPNTCQYCPLSSLEPALGARHSDGRLPALQIRRRERTGRRSKGGGGRRGGGGGGGGGG